MTHQQWDEIGARQNPSWYLDPLVAAQKRWAHLALIHRALRFIPPPHRLLKTDLFEEAFGDDQLLGEFPSALPIPVGIDTALPVVACAMERYSHLRGKLACADLRSLPFRNGAFDFIVSTSSLDHFDSESQLAAGLSELTRVLSPGGVLLITFDNPMNPLYHVLKWAGRARLLPFPLGITPSPRRLDRFLRGLGYEIMQRNHIIHNPRGLSTLLFLALRRLLGRHATVPIGWLLRCFELFGRLPTRSVTACFQAVIAHRPASPRP